MDVDTRVPMRWPCGPLAVAAEKARKESAARDVEALGRFTEPGSLDLLAGTPVDTLVVPWAEGAAADAEQPRAIAPLLAAAAGRKLAVVGWVSDPADLKKAAGAASAAGLAAIATESAQPVEGFEVLRFRKRGVDGPVGAPFLGDADALWPGMRPLALGHDVDAVSGATSRPWIDSNAWYVHLVRGVLAPRTVWLAFDPPDKGWSVTADAYAHAIVDSETAGARWLVSLDRALRAGLVLGQAPARDTWARISRTLGFFRRHAAWGDYPPVAQIGVVSGFAGDDEFLSFELLNLLSRRSALYRPIAKDRAGAAAFAGLDAIVYVDGAPPTKDLAAAFEAFAAAGGTLVVPPGWKAGGALDAGHSFPRFQVFRAGKGRVAVARAAFDDPERLAEDAELLVSHRKDRVRVFNIGIGRYHHAASADGRAGVLHVMSFPSPYPRMPLSAWFERPWKAARDWRIEAADGVAVKREAAEAGVEFHAAPVPVYGALEVTA